jgi:hypothetical protein
MKEIQSKYICTLEWNFKILEQEAEKLNMNEPASYQTNFRILTVTYSAKFRH